MSASINQIPDPGEQEHAVINPVMHDTASRMHRTKAAIAAGIGIGVMTVEVSPINETLRYGTYLGALAASQDRLVGAGALGLSNLVIEGSASVVAAHWLTKRRDKRLASQLEGVEDGTNQSRLSGWFGAKLDKILPKNKEIPLVAQATIAYLGGSAIAQAARIRQIPEVTERELRNYGLKMSGVMSAVVGTQGYFGGEAFIEPSPKTVAVAAVSLIGVPIAVARYNEHRKGSTLIAETEIE